MTKDEMREAIANTMNVCIPDWRFNGCGHRCMKCGKVDYASTWDTKHPPVPNYCNDLNAMHEVEQTLSKDDRFGYCHYLYNIVVPMHEQPFMASAAQRAEAYLRFKGLWHD